MYIGERLVGVYNAYWYFYFLLERRGGVGLLQNLVYQNATSPCPYCIGVYVSDVRWNVSNIRIKL